MLKSNFVYGVALLALLLFANCSSTSDSGEETPTPETINLPAFTLFTDFHGNWDVSGEFIESGITTSVSGSAKIGPNPINSGLMETMILNTDDQEEIEIYSELSRASITSLSSVWYDTKDKAPHFFSAIYQNEDIVAMNPAENMRVSFSHPSDNVFTKSLEKLESASPEWIVVWSLTYTKTTSPLITTVANPQKCIDPVNNEIDFLNGNFTTNDDHYVFNANIFGDHPSSNSEGDYSAASIMSGCGLQIVINGFQNFTGNNGTSSFTHNETYTVFFNSEINKWELFSQAFFDQQAIIQWGGQSYFGIKHWIQFGGSYNLRSITKAVADEEVAFLDISALPNTLPITDFPFIDNMKIFGQNNTQPDKLTLLAFDADRNAYVNIIVSRFN